MGILTALGSTIFGRCLTAFFVSMVPVLELRFAIPLGVTLGLRPIVSMIVCIIGNIVPVPVIIIFSRHVFAWCRKVSPRLGRFADRLERKAAHKGKRLYRGEIIGLILFVAIPLPGTGAWTGAMIAALLNIRLRVALPAIAAGVAIAGFLVTGITLGFSALLS